MIDLTAPEIVEVLVRSDGKVIWINIDGVCRLRACRINKLEINDERKQDDKSTNSNTTTPK